MATVNVLVLRAPGTNCDGETCHAFELVEAKPTRVHVNALLESPRMLADYQVLVIPGGFCYGDDVAAGKILANQLRIGLADELCNFRDSGKLILGICNGFQVLIKSGLLPGWDDAEGANQPATLANNDSGHFEDRWIRLAAEPGACPFLEGITAFDVPIAHGEGKFVCRDEAVLEHLRSSGQIVLRYTPSQVDSSTQYSVLSTSTPDSATQYAARSTSKADPGTLNSVLSTSQADSSTRYSVLGTTQDQTARRREAHDEALPYPINPNGSQADIAGICDHTGRVLGLMPHPERHVDPTQHPQWTRRPLGKEGEGLALFRNAVRFFAK